MRATEEDKRNARLNPLLVSPNPADRAAALGIPRAPMVKLVHRITDLASRFQVAPPQNPPTTGVVLHPATMEPQFTFSVLPDTVQDGSESAAGGSGASNAPRPARAQRCDINKSRHRPVTNPDDHELRHPKHGPMTTKNVVEAVGITVAAGDIARAIENKKILLTDESLAGCVELGWDMSDHFSDSEEEEIESADVW